jgi:Flp pilus assembly protein TadD
VPAAAVPAVVGLAPGEGHAEADPKAATREKSRSQAALESGRLGEAIASGERSVQLDPGDAEAWLILGAAYQSKGDLKGATRAFRGCLDQANRGPKGECAAMVRQR